MTSFDDPNICIKDDDIHSIAEERFYAIGYSEYERVLFVCHCYREKETVIRIISARNANKREKEIYYGKS